MASAKKPVQPTNVTSKTSVPKVLKNKSGKFPSPRKLYGGTKSTDNVSASPWKSIDPVIPIVQVDWEPPSGYDDAKDKYGKGRKTDRKKNGDWF